MSLLLLGYFLLLSLTEGSNKAFTCSPGPLTATCDAGKVILIDQVRRGSYTSAFNDSHCKYQLGDSTERSDGNSKEVWKACNLKSTCSVPFIVSGNYYLEMDYECMYKSNIDMLDICDTGSGTRLVTNHGYIHSPCYPNPSTWTESTYAYCQCSGTFHLPGKAEDVRLSVFHAFQETDSLQIRWHAITNPPETFRSSSPSFKTEHRNIGSFHLSFYSSYRGSHWDRGFWLEFKANSPLEFNCSNRAVKPPTCQAPDPSNTTTPTTTTTSPATPKPTTTTTSTPMTTNSPASTTTPSSTEGGLPGVETTISTVTTTAPSANSPAELASQSQLNHRDVIIPVAVGLAVPLIIVSAVFTSLIIILWRNNGNIAHICKYHAGENTNDGAQNNANADTPGRPVYENVGMDFKNVSGSNFVNHAFDGDQNPSLNIISDTATSSYANVPDMAANSTDNYNQRMPTYENVKPNGKVTGARVLGTGTQSQEATAPMDGDGSPYAEIGDTGASVRGVAAAVESPYAKLEPLERSEYLDLRHIGFADQSHSK